MKRIAIAALLTIAAVAAPTPAVDAQPAPEATIEIAKQHEGLASDTFLLFVVELDCTSTDGPGRDDSIEFASQGGANPNFIGVDQDLECEVTESDAQGADAVEFQCEAIGLPEDAQCTGDNTFEIDGVALNEDARVIITITNIFDQDPTATDGVTTTEAPAAQPVEQAPTFTG
jgi:hypothetical protein